MTVQQYIGIKTGDLLFIDLDSYYELVHGLSHDRIKQLLGFDYQRHERFRVVEVIDDITVGGGGNTYKSIKLVPLHSKTKVPIPAISAVYNKEDEKLKGRINFLSAIKFCTFKEKISLE